MIFLATLKILQNNPDIYNELERKSYLIESAATDSGLNVNRVGSLLTVFFNNAAIQNYDNAKQSDTKKYAEFFGYLLENGIYTAPSQFEAMFVSAAHTDKDIAYTCDIIHNFK